MFPLLQPRNHNNNNNNHKISTYTDGYIQMDMSIPEKKVTKKNILCREALCCVLSSRYQILPYVHIYIYMECQKIPSKKKTNKTKHWTMVLNLFWQLASSSDTSIYIYMYVYLHIYIYIYKYYSFLYIPPQSGSSPASAGSRGTSAGSCRGVTVGPGNKYVLYIYICIYGVGILEKYMYMIDQKDMMKT